MSDKKKVTFGDSVQSETPDDSSGRFKGKHSLDSDEESDGEPDENYVLKEDDIEGQEDSTIDREGEVMITPFNLKEEMEDGHFDSAGNYFVKKDKEIRDEWLEGVDWQKIDARVVEIAKREQDEQFDDAPEEISKISNIKAILGIVKPGETVLKALKRLGGAQQKRSSASMKWKAKRQKVDSEEKGAICTKDNSGDKELLLKLTGLADELLQAGMFSVYQDTFEKMAYQVKRMEKDEKDESEDDALEAAFQEGSCTSVSAVEENNDSPAIDETAWHYKWKNDDEAEIFGPFSTTQMLEWKTEGYFGDGVWVCKTSQSGEFYNSNRIDFDLYI